MKKDIKKQVQGYIAMLRHQAKDSTPLLLSGFELNNLAATGFRAALWNVANELERILESNP